MHFRGRLIDEALTVQRGQHGLAFVRGQGARRGRAGRRRRQRRWAAAADRTRRARGRRCDTRWCRDGCDGAHQSVSSMSRGLQGDPQDLGNFFLERDDCLRPLQLPLQPAVLGLERFTRVDRAPAAPAHCLQGARLALPPPVRQERRVQPLATQQGAHLAGPCTRRLPFAQPSPAPPGRIAGA